MAEEGVRDREVVRGRELRDDVRGVCRGLTWVFVGAFVWIIEGFLFIRCFWSCVCIYFIFFF